MTASVTDDRLIRRFDLWDTDHDGEITLKDYEAEAKRLLNGFGESESTPKGRRLIAAYTRMWDILASVADTDRSGSVSRGEFLAAAAQELINPGDAGFDHSLRPTIEAIVDLCDVDGDGEVSPAEFRRWLQAVGVDPGQAERAFRAMDTDSSGALSVEELVAAVRDYHQGGHDIPLLGR